MKHGGIAIRVTDRYRDRLKNYSLWFCDDFLKPPLQDMDADGLSAEEAMWLWETHGKTAPTRDPEMLQVFKCGKQNRDFHITEWRRGVKQRLFVPEEFFGVLGCRSVAEFEGIFGRKPDHHILRRQLALVRDSIQQYERIYAS